MSEIQPQDILLYAGGDAWRRFGTFVRRTTRIARGGEGQRETFVRADGAAPIAAYLGGDGLYHLAAQNIIRPHWLDTNGDGVVDVLTMLMGGPTRQNVILQSSNYGLWFTSGTPPAPIGGQTDPFGGTGAYLLSDNSGTLTQYFFELPTYTGDGSHSCAIFLKQGTAAVTTVDVLDNTVPIKRGRIDITWGWPPTLSVPEGSATTFTPIAVPGAPGWYLIQFIINNIVAANANQFRILPAGDAASATGTVYAHHAFSDNNGALPIYCPLPTSGSLVTIGNESVTVPIAADTVPQTFYAKFYETGGTRMGSGQPRIMEISRFGVNPRLLLYQSGAKYAFALVTAGGVQYSAGAASTPNMGDLVELCGSWDASSAITITQAINGVAAAPATAASIAAGAPTFGMPVVGLFCDAGGASNTPGMCVRAMVVRGTHTLPECQAVP